MASMDVSREDVLRCARLTRLELGEEEIEPMRAAMQGVLDHARSLDALDLEGVEPWSPAQDRALPLREDVEGEALGQEAALRNAPSVKDGLYSVPR